MFPLSLFRLSISTIKQKSLLFRSFFFLSFLLLLCAVSFSSYSPNYLSSSMSVLSIIYIDVLPFPTLLHSHTHLSLTLVCSHHLPLAWLKA